MAIGYLTSACMFVCVGVDKSDPPLARATLVTDEPACVVVPTQQSATVVTPLIASGTPGDTPHGLGAMGLGR